MAKQLRISIPELTRIQRDLEAVPERSPQDLSRQEALARLSPQIDGLRKKGYKSVGAIAEVLREKGFDVTEAALKKYLGEMARAGGKTRRVRRVTTAETGGSTSSPTADGMADASAHGLRVEPSVSTAKTGSAPGDTSATLPPMRAQPGSGSGPVASTTTSTTAPVGPPKPKAGPSGWTASVSVGTETPPPPAGSPGGDRGGTSSATPAGGAPRATGSGTGKGE